MKNFLKSFGKAILYFLAYFLIQSIVSMVYGVCSVFFIILKSGPDILKNADQFMEQATLQLNAQTTLLLLIVNTLTLLAVWLFFVIRKKKLSCEIQLNQCSKENIIASVLFGIGIAFVLDFFINLIPFPEDLIESFVASHATLSAGNAVINFITVALIAPITEEVIFRGLIYTRLKAGMPVIVAAILSSLMFGIGHGELIWILDAFIAGLALVWVFETTHSLYACIAVHMTNNTIAQLTEYLPETSDWIYLCIIAVSAIILVCSILCLRKINRPQQIDHDFT